MESKPTIANITLLQARPWCNSYSVCVPTGATSNVWLEKDEYEIFPWKYSATGT